MARLSTFPLDENSEVNMRARKQDISPVDRVKLSRHPDRPYLLDYAPFLFNKFSELHGDRRIADDPAMICGFATFHNEPVVIIGHQKGRDLKSRLQRNFGMAKPEGYRKALRVMRLAEKFNRPIFTFVDTQGAHPGVDSEERNVAEAIAHNLREMSRLRTPIIATIIGEGGSGGALGIAVADRVLMQENAYYTVITPENCSTIIWHDQEHVDETANALRLTAEDLKSFGVIDEIVAEPDGGAHADYAGAAKLLDQAITRTLNEIRGWGAEERVQKRYERFRAIGAVQDTAAQDWRRKKAG
ncbi:MAG TPA: acetyl-CoA carboxylase carboxyltransferase subunit alpha [Blastocatellia bacterium]|nr:acetyl-CoA carboxylase carboxyltransferase subunit alpha [Blastocatellia bacterium]